MHATACPLRSQINSQVRHFLCSLSRVWWSPYPCRQICLQVARAGWEAATSTKSWARHPGSWTLSRQVQLWSHNHLFWRILKKYNIILQFWKTEESSSVDNSTWRILKLLKVRDPPRSNQFVYFPKYFSEINISVKYLSMAFLTSSSSPLRSKGWLSSRSSSSHSFSEARTGVCYHPGCTAKLCLPQALAWRAGSGSWALTKMGTLFFICLYFILYYVFYTSD